MNLFGTSVGALQEDSIAALDMFGKAITKLKNVQGKATALKETNQTTIEKLNIANKNIEAVMAKNDRVISNIEEIIA